jgi:hypothetical protein
MIRYTPRTALPCVELRVGPQYILLAGADGLSCQVRELIAEEASYKAIPAEEERKALFESYVDHLKNRPADVRIARLISSCVFPLQSCVCCMSCVSCVCVCVV